MIPIEINDIASLKFELSKFDSRHLFRGQTSHYLKASGDLSIPSSFTRHGCIPPLMIKWTHYSKAILRAFGNFDYHKISLGLAQAILQHYGWRSFFIDLTKSSHVACWFANNKYSDNQQIFMCENFEEDPVWLVHRHAHFERSNSPGHLYVIDTTILDNLNIELHDLTEIRSEDCRLRFHAQHACLAGCIEGYLPSAAICAHLVIPADILNAYYKEDGIELTSDIFPPASEDFILKTLLELPWNRMKIDSPIPTYRRSLELPEYDINFIKHLPPKITLYEDFWVANHKNYNDSPFSQVPFFKLPEESYYAATDDNFELDIVTNIIKKNGRFAIELDGLTKAPELVGIYEYEKGIYVEQISPLVVGVHGLTVSHPGHKVAGAGANLGWFYSIEGNRWTRIVHPDECPCNNDLRHQLQFSILRIFERALRDNQIIRQANNNYCHKNLLSIGKIKVKKV